MKKNMFQILGLALVIAVLLTACQATVDSSGASGVRQLPAPKSVKFEVGVADEDVSLTNDVIAMEFKAPTDTKDVKPADVSYAFWVRQKDNITAYRIINTTGTPSSATAPTNPIGPDPDLVNYVKMPNFPVEQDGSIIQVTDPGDLKNAPYITNGYTVTISSGNATYSSNPDPLNKMIDKVPCSIADPNGDKTIPTNQLTIIDAVNAGNRNTGDSGSLETNNKGHTYAFIIDTASVKAGLAGAPFANGEEVQFGVQTILKRPSGADYYTYQIWYEKYDGTIASEITWANKFYQIR